jgi:hypothetical protein
MELKKGKGYALKQDIPALDGLVHAYFGTN